MLLNNKMQIDDLFKEKVGVYAPNDFFYHEWIVMSYFIMTVDFYINSKLFDLIKFI